MTWCQVDINQGVNLVSLPAGWILQIQVKRLKQCELLFPAANGHFLIFDWCNMTFLNDKLSYIKRCLPTCVSDA